MVSDKLINSASARVRSHIVHVINMGVSEVVAYRGTLPFVLFIFIVTACLFNLFRRPNFSIRSSATCKEVTWPVCILG